MKRPECGGVKPIRNIEDWLDLMQTDGPRFSTGEPVPKECFKKRKRAITIDIPLVECDHEEKVK